MRKLLVIPLVALALVLAACGGSSGGTASPEVTWAKEIAAVMGGFENEVSARELEAINTTSSHLMLEPLYGTYSADLATLAAKLEKTDAPKPCVPLRQRIVADGRRLSRLAGELADQRHLSEEEFALLVAMQRAKMAKVGRELSRLTADPHC